MSVNQVGRRKVKTFVAAGIGMALLLSLGGIQQASPQTAAPTRARHLEHLANVGRDLLQRLRPEVREALSAGGQQLLTIAEKEEDLTAAVRRGSAQGRGPGPRSLPPGAGNDPFAAEDFLTRLSGMTQSETSAGWCASNAVIGFNDSGSFIATLFLGASPSASFSFNGWSRSANAGGSYTDMGALIADPLPGGIMFRDLFGDPVIGCTGAQTFYYASLALDTGPDFSFANSGISLSRSTDGGASFGPAVMAASKDAFTHFLDKPWMAVDPGPTPSGDDDAIHVTYTDFDFSGVVDPEEAICPDDLRVAIEHVRSTDGGATWSDPLVMEEVCEFTPPTAQFLQGSQVEPGIGGDVYVAWERYQFDFEAGEETREIRLSRSTDGGESFEGPQVVTDVTPVGDGFALQGQFRAFLDLQGLAVDRSSGAARGSVYISFTDGRNRSKIDPFAFCGVPGRYCFGDVLFTASTDRGATWSDPLRVNNDDITLGVDQFFPAMDVDRSGTIWIAYYDRRRDVRNFLIDTFIAGSRNGGGIWTNTRATGGNFAPVTGWQDVVVNPFYMGDYIAAAADATGRFAGVIVAWGDNSLGDANVLQRRL